MDIMFILDEISTFCNETRQIWQFIGRVIKLIQIAIPILLVLLGSIDLGKAVMAGEEKEIKEAQTLLIKRIIYGVVVFFAFTIVKGVIGLATSDENANSKCWCCVKSPDNCSCD